MAAARIAPAPERTATLDDYLLRHAAGPKSVPPRHLFLVVMESYEAWATLDKYAALGLADGLRDLAARGLSVGSFLPASTSTMTSLSTLITGLPDCGIMTNYLPASRQSFPTAVAPVFRRLGYRTRLYYGGYLNWQRLEEFARSQGFDEVYGAEHMPTAAHRNEWGVDDEHLFNHIRDTLPADIPSFNLIMSTSFHPPYDVDVLAKGFALTELPPALQSECKAYVDLNVLGHLWYSDRCLARFVAAAERRLPRSLFAITGDHAGRRFIAHSPDAFELAAVPGVFYGPEVLAGIRLPRQVAGSHLDLGPTLIELAAPAGTTYCALGRDLLAPAPHFLGIGRNKVIGPNFLVDVSAEPQVLPLHGGLPPELPWTAAELQDLHHAYLGVAWWRIMTGNQF